MAKEEPKSPRGAIDRAYLAALGKHLSPQKARILLVFTMITAGAPMLMGAAWWDRIPPVVATGLTNFRGQDDSLPRFVVAFGMAGLFCLLEAIAHLQLLKCQRALVLPPAAIRFFGRWGVPVLSVLFSSALIRYGAGAEVWPPAFLRSLILALGLELLGSHMVDCPREALISLRLAGCQSEERWEALHRFAGLWWLAAGCLLLCWTMAIGPSAGALAAAVLSLPVPLLYSHWRRKG